MRIEVIQKKGFSMNAVKYILALVFLSASAGAFGMLQGIYIKEMNFGEDFLGLLIGTKTLAIAVSAFPCALLVNKIGKKKSIIFSMLIISLMTFFQGYCTNRWLMLVFGLLQGSASALLAVTEGPFLMENSSGEGKIRLFSYTFSTNMFSTMAGYYASGHIAQILERTVSSQNAYRYCIIGSGLFGFLSLIFAFMIRENHGASEKCQFISVRDSIGIFKTKGVTPFIVYNLLIGFGAGLVVPFFNVYLKYKINITTSQLGIIMALSQVATGLGGLLTPVLAKKYGKVKTIIFCQIASIPFLLLIATPPSILIVSIAFFMRSALMNMAGPVIGNLSMELVENDKRSVFSSIMNISANFSRAVSVGIAGVIMKSFGALGYEIPYYITTILYIIATVYFYRTFKSFNFKSQRKAAAGMN